MSSNNESPTKASSTSKFDAVLLSKVDKDGNVVPMHNKPLYLDVLSQTNGSGSDSLLLFGDGNCN